MGDYNRSVAMRDSPGHYDGYDIWMNFTYKGDDNPIHNHAGDFPLSSMLKMMIVNQPFSQVLITYIIQR